MLKGTQNILTSKWWFRKYRPIGTNNKYEKKIQMPACHTLEVERMPQRFPLNKHLLGLLSLATLRAPAIFNNITHLGPVTRHPTQYER